MPVRRTNRGYGGLTGHLGGTRSEPGVRFESALEKDLFNLLRYQRLVVKEVKSFEEQPVRIDFEDAEGTPRHYTPDVLIVYHGHRPPELIEVKYWAELRLKLKELRPGFQAAQAYCRARGWQFRVRTERSIRTPLLEHARFFPAYLNRDHQPDDIRTVLMEVQRQGETTVMAVLDQLAPDLTPQNAVAQLDEATLRRARLLAVLWTLVALGFVQIDLAVPPSCNSRLWARSY